MWGIPTLPRLQRHSSHHLGDFFQHRPKSHSQDRYTGRANVFVIGSLNGSIVSTSFSRLLTHSGSWFGDHWHIQALNVETIGAVGLQMGKPLTFLGSKWGNQWGVWALKVKTIYAFELCISTVKVSFFLLFRQKKGKSGFSPMNKWLFWSQLQHIKSFWNMIGSL